MLYFETEKGLTAYIYVGDAPKNTCIELTDGCKSINEGAFNTFGCNGITGINIPSSVEYIGNGAFSGTYFSDKFIIPSNIKYLGGSFLHDTIEHFEIQDSSEPLEIGDQSSAYPVKTIYYGRDIVASPNPILSTYNEDGVEITLGPLVTEVGYEMNVGYNIKSYTVKAMNPPIVKKEGNEYYSYYPAFENGRSIDFENCPLIVPKGTVESYRSAPGWSLFKNIIEDEKSAITDINTSIPSVSDSRHYDINGRIINPDSKGIHIVVDSNGKVSKKLIR